ncbi:winged helix-turn-helix transcriptional regulator [Niveispirillum sp. KHB5.9]|uniref:winged helix-turn-helix transcriptional regulator n=1 Tax=Niveispirillum sp. KHB5.9 TaxID=3400269 RepID=UPI003A865DB9
MLGFRMEPDGHADMRWDELDQEACPVARCVAVIGDRWNLMLLRDCFMGVRRFEDFQARLGITRHVLADRLRGLVAADILRRAPYHEGRTRYEYRLTPSGMDLYPVIMAMVTWSNTHRLGAEGRPLLYRHKGCGKHFDAKLVCSECGEALDPRHTNVEMGPGMPSDQMLRHAPVNT